MSTEQQPFWRGRRGRLLLASLAGLVTVGIVLGLVIAWASTTVLEAAGIGSSEDSADATPTEPEPTTGDSGSSPDDEPSDGESTEDETEPSSTPSGPPPPVLNASATTAAPLEEVQLTGRFPGLAAGVPLQIERKEDGQWALFPVGVSTTELGEFSINVATGQPGANLFRVTDPQTDISTPTVTIQVG